jgi:predicted ATPase
MLGLATALTGRIEDGLTHVAAGLTEAEHTEQRLHLANLHRFRGQILLLPGDPAGAVEAAECFTRALAVARTLGAAGPALQAGLQLAHLRQAQGRPAEARALLAPLYASFTEGLDTADLRRARALLTAL